MRPGSMVVVDLRGEHAAQMAFVRENHVVQAVPPENLIRDDGRVVV